jgi:hypothetical protein
MGPLLPLLALALLAAPPDDAGARLRACERRIEQGREADACLAALEREGAAPGRLALLQARHAFLATRLDEASTRLAGLGDEPEAVSLRRLVDAYQGHASDYKAREILRSDGVVLRWRHPADEVFVYLLPSRLAALRARLSEALGGPFAPPAEIILASDRDDLAALAGLPVDEVRATRLAGTARHNRVLLLSPGADPEGPPFLENLAHQLTLHAIARSFGPDVPHWLAEGVAQVQDGRFEAPGGRRWLLPPEDVARRTLSFDPSQTSRTSSRADVGLLGALVVKGVLRAHGAPALVDLLASGGTSLPRSRLVTLLVDEWTREARRPTFSGPPPARQSRDEAVERPLRLARLLLASNHPHAALAELRKAHARDRSVHTGLLLLPLAVQLGEWETAKALCEGLPKADAEGYAYRFFCGQLRMARQEYAAAAEAFERAVDFQPYDAPAHQALLQVREQQNDSRAKLDQALILDAIGARKEEP